MSRSPSSRMLLLVGALSTVAIAGCRENEAPDSAARRAMVSDLEALARGEILYFRNHGRFSSDAESTGAMQSIGVSKPVITLVADTGFTATVQREGITCAIGVFAVNPLRKSAESGVPACMVDKKQE